MKTYVRTRPGMDGDTIYEKKRWWLFLVPKLFGMGYFPFANSASARNHKRQELNDLCKKQLKILHELADTELFVSEEHQSLNSRKRDRWGISIVELMPNSFLKQMLPYKPEVDEYFKEVINRQVINRIFKEHGVDIDNKSGLVNRSGSKGNIPDLMLTSEAGARDFDPKKARHVTSFKVDKKKNLSGNNGQNKKQLRKEMVRANPREDDEDDSEYQKRINGYMED